MTGIVPAFLTSEALKTCLAGRPQSLKPACLANRVVQYTAARRCATLSADWSQTAVKSLKFKV